MNYNKFGLLNKEGDEDEEEIEDKNITKEVLYKPHNINSANNSTRY